MDYSEFRVFGCLAVMSNLTISTDKFVAKAIPCVFLGYPTSKKGCKFLNLIDRTTFMSRDTKFHASVFPLNTSGNTPYVLPLPVSLSVPTPSSCAELDEIVPSLVDNSASTANTSNTDDTGQVPVRKTQRQSKPPSWLQDYATAHNKVANIAQTAQHFVSHDSAVF